LIIHEQGPNFHIVSLFAVPKPAIAIPRHLQSLQRANNPKPKAVAMPQHHASKGRRQFKFHLFKNLETSKYRDNP
jgi:hypothetical protein